MSSSDVRDILSLPNRATTAESGQHRAPARAPPTLPGDTRQKQRPEGMSRELYALLGPNAPSLVMSSAAGGPDGLASSGGAQPTFQPKFQRKANSGVVRRWAWTPFRNPAREDTPSDTDSAASEALLGQGLPTRRGLVLHHWKPVLSSTSSLSKQSGADDDDKEMGDEVALDEAWAPFNTSSQVFHYTTEEYTQYLTDSDWTRDETDYLIDMCEMYDLRFIVIADRYEWPGSHRTIEDLKARYYTICRRLLRERISNENVETRHTQLQTFAYDRQQEMERKNAVQKLFSRTPEQLAEEEALYVEARRLEQNETKFARERADLLRLLGGFDGVPSYSAATVAAVGAGLVWPGSSHHVDQTFDDKKHKRRRTDVASPPAKSKSDAKQQLFDAQHFITRFSTTGPHVLRTPYPNLIGTPSALPPVASATSGSSTKSENAAHHGAYLRSTRMLTFRPNQYTRVMQALSELHPPVGARLVFPTATNVEKWETLLGAVAGGLEIKKQLDRVEAEYQIARARLAAAEQAAAEAPPPRTESGTSGTKVHGSETESQDSTSHSSGAQNSQTR